MAPWTAGNLEKVKPPRPPKGGGEKFFGGNKGRLEMLSKLELTSSQGSALEMC